MARKLLTLLLCIALPLPALAQPHVIAQLGTAPLIGQVASTQQLQGDVSKQREIFAAAGRQLGLTSAEFDQFSRRIARRQLTYVVIPRHLDAMSWRSGERVHVLHDVVIPAHTMGWEVDLAEKGQTVALFIPNKCGNLSLLRRPAPLVARVDAVQTVAPSPSPSPAPTVAPTQAPAPTPAPATPAPYTSAAMSTGPAHHFRIWPLLLLPIVGLIVSHGHSGPPIGTTPLVPSIPPAAPTPAPVAGCSPTPH
ncbi:MAG TPA: hypothetical protein VJP85_00475 [Candidatus Baltobacteraceae bacterium]|nr:hypothetical protein [Candidatus Baltobacteraceae bacterium]